MPITVQCTNCQFEYAVGEQFVGKRVKCKQCGNIFTIESSPEDPFANASFKSTAVDNTPVKKWNLPPVLPDDVAKPAPISGQGPSIVATPRRVRQARFQGLGASDNKLVYYILFLYVAVTLVLGVYATVKIFTQPQTFSSPSTSVAVLWSLVFLFNILLYALHGPMILVGIWSASKIFNFQMKDGTYLRSCAVAALPTVLVCVALWNDLLVRIVIILFIAPVLLWLIKLLFNFEWTSVIVGSTIGIAAWFLGILLQCVIVNAMGSAVSGALVIADGMPTFGGPAVSSNNGPANPAVPSGSPSTNVSSEQLAQMDAVLIQFHDNIQAKVDADYSLVTREEKMSEVTQAKHELELYRPRFQNQPEWPDAEKAVKDFADKVASRPSGAIDPAIFTETKDPQDLSTSKLSSFKLAEEVSFGQFKFKPPQAMKLQLDSSEDLPNGLVWIGIGNPRARLSIFSRPRLNAKQLKPFFTPELAVMHKAEVNKILAIDSTNLMDPDYGLINGIAFTHTSTKLGPADEHTEQFIAPADDHHWIYIQLDIPPENGSFTKIMVISARSLRAVETDEARSDPFSAVRVAPRLAEDYDRVSAILKKDPGGEDVVIDLLSSNDAALRRRTVDVLNYIATEKSIPALQKLSESEKDIAVATKARDIIARIKGNG